MEEYIHLPVSASSTPLVVNTQVWVVDFESESCRLRVVPALVSTPVTSRGSLYEKDMRKKAQGHKLRFDMANTAADTWWYAVCDISTSAQDAERRLTAVLNRRYKAGYMEHCDIRAAGDIPLADVHHPPLPPVAVEAAGPAVSETTNEQS